MGSENPIRFCLQPGLCRVLQGQPNRTGAYPSSRRQVPSPGNSTRGSRDTVSNSGAALSVFFQIGDSISLEPGS